METDFHLMWHKMYCILSMKGFRNKRANTHPQETKLVLKKIEFVAVCRFYFSQEVPYSQWLFDFFFVIVCLATFTNAIMAFDETKKCDKFRLPEMP